ncbi:HAD-superfamily hydrolase subfamily IA, variant 3 [Nitrobacter sp. Nb-311A]|uniref:HAD family hydrolase n=1 Tax=unclassified Nitrobacter TaxID=2620411 RepID=UPI0000686012|nr:MULTISPECIES: HAD hydrolase-like protein [unclassified Nitrobacter]EAQ36832.1 HAD-superfamily hydrolase subfamily IA, variant 3 [Nitrobacter sp. Nb-311A]MCB1394085.1 HAD family phosphatase [Nitrobacter sp.]MCV0385506.1 HAD family hydrolase [Nitrobacter sp.]
MPEADASPLHSGLFLDLDGTLADSLTALKNVYQSFLASFGASGDDVEFQQLNGPPLGEIIDRLKLAHKLPGTPADLLQKYAAMVSQAQQSVLPAAGAHELLAHVRACGLKIAVVTSSPKLFAQRWLAFGGLADKIDDVVGGDEVSAGKPAAEPYIRALTRLNCSPALSHAVEDSRIGAMSAVAAGLKTWALASPNNRAGWPAQVVFIERLTDLLGRIQAC